MKRADLTAKVFGVTLFCVALIGCEMSGARPSESPAAPVPHASASEPVNAAGRYQLFQGWYRFVNLRGEENRTETLFKIDTATGEMFECSSVQFTENGKNIQRTACHPFENDLPLGPVATAK